MPSDINKPIDSSQSKDKAISGSDASFDQEGFLIDLESWNAALAQQIALSEGITLDVLHWELIELIQRFYREFDHSPAMRPLVKYVTRHLGAEKGRSIYLLGLFPGSPAKIAAKIAGLPRPENCL